MTVHSIFICEPKKGRGNDAELFRLVDIEEQWCECEGDLAGEGSRVVGTGWDTQHEKN